MWRQPHFIADVSRLGGFRTSSHAPLLMLIRFVEALGVSLVPATCANFVRLVGSSGLEPPTSCLSGTRSNLLSYEPVFLFALLRRFTTDLVDFFVNQLS